MTKSYKRKPQSEERTAPLFYSPTRWTATPCNTAEDKEKTYRAFICLVGSDFAESAFPRWLYEHVHMHLFGHIAHYSREGFIDEYFRNTATKFRFLRDCLNWPWTGVGDPTFSDVERELSRWLKERKILETYERRMATEHETIERAMLAHLKEKYEGGQDGPQAKAAGGDGAGRPADRGRGDQLRRGTARAGRAAALSARAG